MPALDTYSNTELGQTVIIYGAPKTGKTQLAGSLAEEGYNLIWIDCEKGSQTLKTSLPLEAQKRVDLYRVEDTKEKPHSISTCIKLMSMRPQVICHTHGAVACPVCKAQNLPTSTLDFSKLDTKTVVVFDSLTQISDSAMAAATLTLNDLGKLEFKHYDEQGIRLRMFLSAIQNCGHFHIVVISHEAAIEQGDKVEKIMPCGGTKNFSRNVPKYFDHVIYSRIHNNKHQFASSTAFNMKFVTGSRSNLAMESGAVTLGDLLKAKPIIGGGAEDLQESETGETQVKVNALYSKGKTGAAASAQTKP